MKQFNYILKDENGIHARPAGMLVKEASKYESAINIQKGEKTADAKRLFSIMSLAAKKGDELSFSISGQDESDAAKSLENFLKTNL